MNRVREQAAARGDKISDAQAIASIERQLSDEKNTYIMPEIIKQGSVAAAPPKSALLSEKYAS